MNGCDGLADRIQRHDYGYGGAEEGAGRCGGDRGKAEYAAEVMGIEAGRLGSLSSVFISGKSLRPPRLIRLFYGMFAKKDAARSAKCYPTLPD